MPKEVRGRTSEVSSSLLARGLFQSLTQARTQANQGGQVVEGDHVRSIAQGLIRSRMGLDENAVAARGDGGPRQVRHHAAVAVALVARACRFLYAVSGVKDHRTAQILHPR